MSCNLTWALKLLPPFPPFSPFSSSSPSSFSSSESSPARLVSRALMPGFSFRLALSVSVSDLVVGSVRQLRQSQRNGNAETGDVKQQCQPKRATRNCASACDCCLCACLRGACVCSGCEDGTKASAQRRHNSNQTQIKRENEHSHSRENDRFAKGRTRRAVSTRPGTRAVSREERRH